LSLAVFPSVLANFISFSLVSGSIRMTSCVAISALLYHMYYISIHIIQVNVKPAGTRSEAKGKRLKGKG
jgi:hypothetical protein